MRKKIILRLFLLTAFMAIPWSCRSEDFAKSESDAQRNNADFFKHQTSLSAKNGTDYISILEAYNKEKDFLSTMSDQKGMPLWDKVQITDSESSTGAIIPLSYDDKTMSSLLFVTFDEKNSVSGLNNCDNDKLKSVVYDGKIDKNFREQLFYTFMYMDNLTFGNEFFTGIPRNMFEGKKYDNVYGRMRIKDFHTPEISHNESSKILYIKNCGNVWSCKNHESYANCDHCSACYTTACYDTTIWIPDETFPGPGGSSGGGGGGAGPSEAGNPPKDPCTQGGPFYRPAPGCGANGPEIVIDDQCERAEEPVNNVNKILHASTIATEKKALEDHAKDDFTEYGMAIVSTGSSIIAQDPYSNSDPSNPGSVSIIFPTIGDPLASAHTHPSHGAAPPSVKDLYSTINETTVFPTFQASFVFAHNGTKYAFVITDRVKALAFLAAHPFAENTTNGGAIFNDSFAIGKDFLNIYEAYIAGTFSANSGNEQNVGMESAYAHILNKYDAGISIAKTDTAGNLKALKSITFKHTVPYSGGKKVTAIKAEPCP